MKQKNPIALLFGWIAVALSPAQLGNGAERGADSSERTSASQGPGVLSGAVSSVRTGSMLQGAIAEIPALNRQAVTDDGGRFLLTGLPLGSFEVTVSYIGLKEERRTVKIGAASPRPLAFELAPTDIITLEKFTVASEREGNALAITSQRNAANVKNVVAMDAFGNMPNLGAGEVLTLLPGVAPEYNSEGIVGRVSVRGMPISMTSTTVDGNPVFRGNGVRWISYSGMSGATYEQLELTKGQTPDRSANSIGGGVNLKSRSPLSMKENRRITYNLSARWAPPFFEHGVERREHPIHPLFNVSYQKAFDVAGGERNLGVSLSVFHSENVNGGNVQRFIYPNLTTSPAYIYDYRSAAQINNRQITNADIRLEYRPSMWSKFILGINYNLGWEKANDTNTVRFVTSQTIATIGSDGQPTGTGAILPGFTDARTQVRAVPASTVELSAYHSSFSAESPAVNFQGEHKFTSLDIDYKIAHTSMHLDRGHGKPGDGGTLTLRAPGIGWVLDRADPEAAILTQTEGPSMYELASYTGSMTHINRDEIEQTWATNAEVNVAYRPGTAFPLTLSSGLAFERRQNNLTSQGNAQWTRVAGAPLLPNQLGYPTDFEERHGMRLPVVDSRVSHSQLSNTALWSEDLYYREVQKRQQQKTAVESIGGAYVMARAKFNRLGLLGGVRVERTDVTGEGYARRRQATVAQIPDPVERARYDWGVETKNKGSYTRSFPSIHSNYDFTRNFKARASWSTSFGRPDFTLLAPSASINDTAQTVTVSNPGLGPQYSKNLDLTLEYYLRPAGLFTIGYFEKSIEDFILTADVGIVESGPNNGYLGDYSGYTIRSSTNAGTAEVKGWEIDYRQRLTFLPGLLKGLEVAANYTRLTTHGDFGGTTTRTSSEVAEFVPRSANASLAYTYKRYSTRINASYYGDYLRTFNAQPALRLFRKSTILTSWNFSYRWRPGVTFSCDITNVFGVKRQSFQGVHSRVREVWGSPAQMITFGVSGVY